MCVWWGGGEGGVCVCMCEGGESEGRELDMAIVGRQLQGHLSIYCSEPKQAPH